MDEIRAIGLMPEQSTAGIEIDPLRLHVRRLAKGAEKPSLMGRPARSRGKAMSSAALESIRAANGLAAHLGEVEAPVAARRHRPDPRPDAVCSTTRSPKSCPPCRPVSSTRGRGKARSTPTGRRAGRVRPDHEGRVERHRPPYLMPMLSRHRGSEIPAGSRGPDRPPGRLLRPGRSGLRESVALRWPNSAASAISRRQPPVPPEPGARGDVFRRRRSVEQGPATLRNPKPR
jgi:hypothetical protein